MPGGASPGRRSTASMPTSRSSSTSSRPTRSSTPEPPTTTRSRVPDRGRHPNSLGSHRAGPRRRTPRSAALRVRWEGSIQRREPAARGHRELPPNPATGGDRARVQVTFTAAADARRLGCVFIRARPVDAAAGADIRSATTFLSVQAGSIATARHQRVPAVQGLGTLLPGPATNGGDYRGTGSAPDRRPSRGLRGRYRCGAAASKPASCCVARRRRPRAPRQPAFPIWAPNGIQRATPGCSRRARRPRRGLHVRPAADMDPRKAQPACRDIGAQVPLPRDQVPVVNALARLRREQQLRPARHRFERIYAYWIAAVGIVRDGGRPLAPPSRVSISPGR